jgi:phosphatidylserine decarboxylase
MNIAKGSLSWILILFVIALISLFLFVIFNKENIALFFFFLSIIVFLLTIFLIIFFRDPERIIGKGITACADGKIREIINIDDKDIGSCVGISTFMSVSNVHVNRMVFEGTIKSIKHVSGSHIPAFKKESEKNERVIILIDTKIGKIKIVQIAGIIARRIVPYIKKDDKIRKGERIGIIRLGSRVDVYLPLKKIKKIYVKVGDNVKAGEDTIAEINA